MLNPIILSIKKHTKGLVAFSEEYNLKRKYIASADSKGRLINDVTNVSTWKIVFEKLGSGEIICRSHQCITQQFIKKTLML
jgi:hypothetical protein